MRLTSSNSALCVIDIQERLLPTIPTGPEVVTESCRLLEAAALFEVPVLVTEQYPKGLGSTVPAVTERLKRGGIQEKLSFSCCGSPGFIDDLPPHVDMVVLCGLETHVCIAQTALDLLETGHGVCLAVDAIGSRFAIDHEVALRRLEAAGVVLSTSEAILFEWCRSAEHPAFREMRSLLKARQPPAK
jgi:nicotinamidase-related amidase